ncbi:MAG TPA: hypothetical protein VMU26_04675 [Candidatus Polarisedimenticolia bacterium]|nr:hypothetical protein [Candidatus Polarisedimenticolia bacterium]
MRILPLLDRHIREDDWVGGLPPGASDLVAHSEHEGGIGGLSIRLTAPQSIISSRSHERLTAGGHDFLGGPARI